MSYVNSCLIKVSLQKLIELRENGFPERNFLISKINFHCRIFFQKKIIFEIYYNMEKWLTLFG